jgi:pilus assembly protein Flp/PilA
MKAHFAYAHSAQDKRNPKITTAGRAARPRSIGNRSILRACVSWITQVPFADAFACYCAANVARRVCAPLYPSLPIDSVSLRTCNAATERAMTYLRRFIKDESGATAIEYGLIAAGISVAIIATVNSLGGQLKNTFSKVSTSLANAGK